MWIMALSVRAQKGGSWNVGSGLSGLYLKTALMGGLFTISKNWLTLGGVVHSGSGRPQMSKHQNTEDKKHWLHCHYYYSGISVPLISAFTPKPTEMTEIAKGNQNYLENSQEQGRKQNNNRGFWFKMTA